MHCVIVERPDGTPMLHTLSNEVEGAKKLALAGSGSMSWKDFDEQGYKLALVTVKRLSNIEPDDINTK